MMRPINYPKIIRLVFLYIGVGLALFWALAPIYWVLVSSISTRTELYATPEKVWFPAEPTFQNYTDIFTTGPRYRAGGFLPTADLMRSGVLNSINISLSTALLVTAIATGTGYVFARLKFRGKNLLFIYFMLMMTLPIWVSIITLYFVMSSLGLVDTIHGMVLILATQSLPLSIWLMTTYIREIPIEIQEAALVDGGNRWQILWSIIFPLARPGMAAVFLITLLNTWNNFLVPLIFSRTTSSQPMTVVLTLFIGQYEVAWEAMSAAAVITMIPPLILALFFQRYLIRGLTLGAVK